MAMRNLKAEMVRLDIKIEDIAKTINKTGRCVRDKISCKRAFTFPEAIAIRDKHFPKLDLEYLFNNNR